MTPFNRRQERGSRGFFGRTGLANKLGLQRAMPHRRPDDHKGRRRQRRALKRTSSASRSTICCVPVCTGFSYGNTVTESPCCRVGLVSHSAELVRRSHHRVSSCTGPVLYIPPASYGILTGIPGLGLMPNLFSECCVLWHNGIVGSIRAVLPCPSDHPSAAGRHHPMGLYRKSTAWLGTRQVYKVSLKRQRASAQARASGGGKKVTVGASASSHGQKSDSSRHC